MRDQAGKEMLAKQLQGLNASLPAFLDIKTGVIKSKKQKKEKTPDEEAWQELKKLEKKPLGSNFDALNKLNLLSCQVAGHCEGPRQCATRTR